MTVIITVITWLQDGKDGPRGPAGPDGKPGRDGADGEHGEDGEVSINTEDKQTWLLTQVFCGTRWLQTPQVSCDATTACMAAAHTGADTIAGVSM